MDTKTLSTFFSLSNNPLPVKSSGTDVIYTNQNWLDLNQKLSVSTSEDLNWSLLVPGLIPSEREKEPDSQDRNHFGSCRLQILHIRGGDVGRIISIGVPWLLRQDTFGNNTICQ